MKLPFISFEGSEGCGKSTQIRLLAEALQASGREVVTTREPGGTPIGESIRRLLQFDPEAAAMTSEAELLLFTASRAQLVREVIAPALRGGSIVIADRFLDSTTVYQGVARRLPPETVDFINRFAVGDCLPDITIVLDVDAETAARRMQERARPSGHEPDRMESEPAAFYEAVREGYLALAAREPGRVRVVDGGASKSAVFKNVKKQIAEVCHGLFA